MKKGDMITISNGRIRFESVGMTKLETEWKKAKFVWVVPLNTFSMRMAIIDEENGEYKHIFSDNGREIEVDGATWMEAQDMLFDNPKSVN